MTNNITYKEVGATITVRVGKRIAGFIIPVGEGFQYQTLSTYGKIYPTVEEVKRSLEG